MTANDVVMDILAPRRDDLPNSPRVPIFEYAHERTPTESEVYVLAERIVVAVAQALTSLTPGAEDVVKDPRYRITISGSEESAVMFVEHLTDDQWGLLKQMQVTLANAASYTPDVKVEMQKTVERYVWTEVDL